MATRSPLAPIVKKFFESDPVTAAHSLEVLDNREAIAVLKTLPSSLASQVFPRLTVEHAIGLLKDVEPEKFKEIVEKIDPQLGASIFVHLAPEIRENFLVHLSEKTKKRIQELLTYPENSAGRIMSGDFVTFHTDLKVKEVVQKIRVLAKNKVPITYFYVTDADHHLVGILNMRDLLLSSNDVTIDTVMRKDIFTVHVFTDRAEIAVELSKRKYMAAPVIDSENRLLGVVKADQLLAHVQAEASEDILKMFGAGGDERTFSSIGFAIQKRLPWLCVNLITAFLAAAVVGLFENIIAKFTILAVFLPVVAGQGGNTGAQSLAVVMRGIVLREIPQQKVWTLITKESLIGTINGVVIGILTGLVVWIWHGNPFFGVIIGLAMIVNMFAAGLSGAAIPLAMKAIGLDPAQSSSIIQTTVTDVVGNASFLGFAVLLQKYMS